MLLFLEKCSKDNENEQSFSFQEDARKTMKMNKVLVSRRILKGDENEQSFSFQENARKTMQMNKVLVSMKMQER